MEDRPWTKSEFFAWSDGRRIVDLYELSKQLQCKHCCSLLDLRRTERETRYGLASILYVVCNCGVINDVHTGKTQNDGNEKSGANSSPMYEINIKASINLLMYGAGASRILNFLALLDIPVPPPDDTSLIVPVTEEPDHSNNPASAFISQGSALPAATAVVFPPADATVSQQTLPQTTFTVPQPNSDTDSDPALGNDEEDNSLDDEGMDDDDDDYVPSSKSRSKGKAKAKPKFNPSQKKKATLQGPRSVREKLREKLKKAEMAKKIRVPKTKEKDATEEETGTVAVPKVEDEEDSRDKKLYLDPDDILSSSESEEEKVKKKRTESDESWHEDNDETEEEPEPEPQEEGKRKRGRPPGSKGKGPKKPRVSKGNIPRCNSCDKDFTCLKGYNLHMKRVHNDDTKESELESDWTTIKEEKVTDCLYLCPECNQLFAQSRSLISHLKKAHQQDLADVEKFGISMENSILRLNRVYKDSLRYKRIFKCLVCNTILQGVESIGQHIRVDDNRQLSCETMCPAGSMLGRCQRPIIMKVSKQNMCCICGMQFRDRCNMIGHEWNVHGLKPNKMYSCELCSFTSHVSTKVRIHKEMNHSITKSVLCELCGKSFYNRPSMAAHVRRTHLAQKKHKCKFCPLMFKARSCLRRHELLHAGIREHKCRFCQKAFAQAYSLRVHERIHTGEKPYQCKECSAAFAQKVSLDAHMMKH